MDPRLIWQESHQSFDFIRITLCIHPARDPHAAERTGGQIARKYPKDGYLLSKETAPPPKGQEPSQFFAIIAVFPV
jgi:hypothetical protein